MRILCNLLLQVRLVIDRMTKRSKGFGYVEFADQSSIPQALQLHGTILGGVPIMIKASEAEKNVAAELAFVFFFSHGFPFFLPTNSVVSNSSVCLC